MNRITELFCSIFLLAAAATSADAQTTLGDAVSVGEVAVSRDGERVFVAMDIDIRSLQLKSNNDLCLTPYIAAGGDTLRMPVATAIIIICATTARRPARPFTATGGWSVSSIAP